MKDICPRLPSVVILFQTPSCLYMFLSNNFCDNMVAMAGWHPPCNNALKVLSSEMDLAESISSFDRSSLMSEARRFL